MIEPSRLTELVEKAQSGDKKALDILFENSYDDIYYFILKTVKDPDLASDLTQETFMTVYKSIKSLKEPSAFVTWIRRIAYHSCTGHFKKRQDVLVEEDEDGGSIFDTLAEEGADFIPDAALDQDEFKKTILSIINELTEEQRSAVLMYYYEELSVKQIAEIQNVSEGTVKSRLNYARKAIKESVEKYEREHDIKLHSFALLPLLLWLFRKDNELVPKRFPQPKKDLPSSGDGGKGKSTKKAAKSAAGASAKSASGGIALKIIAGIVSVSLLAGAGVAILGGGIAIVAAVLGSNKQDDEIIVRSEIFASGNGTIEDPYIIETPEQLLDFAKESNRIYEESGKSEAPFKDAYIALGDDISLIENVPVDFSSIKGFFESFYKALTRYEYEWVTIECFGGVFNGNGHTIDDLDKTMFGTIAEGAMIYDVHIASGSIDGPAVIAVNNYSVVRLCHIDRMVTLSYDSNEYEFIGGIVANNYGAVLNAHNRGEVKAKYANAAGIVGYNYGYIVEYDFRGTVSSEEGFTNDIAFGAPKKSVPDGTIYKFFG